MPDLQVYYLQCQVELIAGLDRGATSKKPSFAAGSGQEWEVAAPQQNPCSTWGRCHNGLYGKGTPNQTIDLKSESALLRGPAHVLIFVSNVQRAITAVSPRLAK
jgi:hypothetical protein